jgi:UDP-glucose 4-epimerase
VNVLVTGGAGYIGSHVVKMLIDAGNQVISVDDLSTGNPGRLQCQSVQLALESEESTETLTRLMSEHKIDSVIHLAARKQVGVSVEKPEHYYLSNVAGLANLLLAMRNADVKKMVFSSSAAVYGMPNVEKVTETDKTEPINPYGQTKLIGEWMISNAKVWGLSAISLRYFNVAGAGWTELADRQALNLIPIILKKIREGQAIEVFGDDYETPDGSCIRDYIHVQDLARAHIDSITALTQPGNEVFNVGTGKGSSVFEVIDEIKKTSGVDFEVRVSRRRAGDPPKLVASSEKIETRFGWKAEFGLAEIVESAWNSREL